MDDSKRQPVVECEEGREGGCESERKEERKEVREVEVVTSRGGCKSEDYSGRRGNNRQEQVERCLPVKQRHSRDDSGRRH